MFLISIDFLKIDYEGCKYALINDLLKYGLMDKIIGGIVFEAHNIDEELNTNRLKILLKSYEFKNVQIHGKDGNTIQIIK